jgi:hypothetical protein
MFIFNYIILGTVFMFIMDGLHIALKSNQEPFNNWERLVIIVSWPIPFIIFIFNMIKGFIQR